MMKFSSLTNIARKARAGFTMIELLIVIAILGILATAVLSAINPVEQINRGRDTGTRSDAEQLLSAIDRYNAFRGYFPWMTDANDKVLSLKTSDDLPIAVSSTTPLVNGSDSDKYCYVLDRLAGSTAPLGSNNCSDGSDEIKTSFINRIVSSSARTLYIYNQGNQGDSTYVCFLPQSAAFRTDAEKRCGNTAASGDTPATFGANMPADMSDTAAAALCGAKAPSSGVAMVCLP